MDPITGGVAQTIRNLLPLMEHMGVRSEVLCFDAPSSTALQTDEGFIVHRIGPSVGRWGRVKGFCNWLDANADQFDVILLHGLWLYNGYAYTKWLRQKKRQSGVRIPCTWIMPHGMLDPWFQRAPGRRIKSVRNLIYWLMIESRTISSSDLLIFTSEAELQKASISFPFYRPKRRAIVPLGVPDPFIDNSLDCSNAERFPFLYDSFILALGRIDPKKGFDILPEVWSHLIKDPRYASRLPILVIAGPGWESDYGTRVKERIDALELGDRILTVGMLQGASKWAALRSCEALIMPSHQENFGLVAAEALACGKPVLLSYQVDIQADIIAMDAGFSDNDTVAGITQIVMRWVDLQPEKQDQMKSAARTLFLDRFSIDQTATRLIRLLKDH
jgi:glycosyltransferase involved in cell wall biosynthesis